MIGAIFWKEWREQRIVALAVLSFGALSLALTAFLADPTTGGGLSNLGVREVMPLALAYLAGTVCGAILLADEKEVGTLEFLDTLPGQRRGLWFGKLVFGLTLSIGQSALIAGLAVALGTTSTLIPVPAYAVGVVLVGLVAFAWGYFGGALARSVLGAVFLGSTGFFFAAILVGFPFAALFGNRMFVRPFGALQVLTYALLLIGLGVIGSAALFLKPDFERGVRPESRVEFVRRKSTRRPWLPGLRAVVWLSARQAVWIGLAACGLGLLSGAVQLAPDAQPLFVWPVATLTLGVLAGVTVLGEEQARGVAQFWAERRLPLGRLWMAKVMFHFGIAVIASLLMFGLLALASSSDPFRTRLVMELRPELFRFLLFGLVYGFVVGQLAGMALRKTVDEGLVAVVSATTFAGLQIPSILGGGAGSWQVWGPAILLLLTARALLYPWATGRVGTRGPTLRAAFGVGGAILLLLIGISYRVLEVPNVPDRLAASGFEERIPSYDVDEGRRLTRGAVSQFRAMADSSRALVPNRPVLGGSTRGPVLAMPGPTPDPLDLIARQGWTRDSDLLRPWLDRVFSGDWVKVLDDIPNKPLGAFDDPRNQHFLDPRPVEDLRDLQTMTITLRARGAQRQIDGDPAEYIRLLRGGLAAVRTARHFGTRDASEISLRCEDVLLAGTFEWLGRLSGDAPLLRKVLVELDRHEREMPVGLADTFWADQLVLRSSMDQIATWLPRFLARRTPNGVETTNEGDPESALVGFAWSVPWERLRRDRLLRVNADASMRVDLNWLSKLHLGTFWPDRTARLESFDRRGLTLRRFVRLKTAIILYQEDRGVPAQALTDLVPSYLDAVPADPYTTASFKYRVSKGEVIDSSSRDVRSASIPYVTVSAAIESIAYPFGGLTGLVIHAPPHVPPLREGRDQVEIPPGTGILWVTGIDGKDDGGQRAATSGENTQAGEDWLMLVPVRRK